MRELFEKWVVSHFGGHVKDVLSEFDEEEGYIDPVVNAMWIGFNGYAILKGDIK